MDNLPKDPPDSENNNPTPPPFGSNFNPHSNPIDPNNPYSSQPSPQPSQNPPPEDPDSSKHATYSEVAQQKQRDAHGRFIHSEHLADPTPPNFPNTPNIPNSKPMVRPLGGPANSGLGAGKRS